MRHLLPYALGLATLAVLSCEGPTGPIGTSGTQGPQGPEGPPGPGTRTVLSAPASGGSTTLIDAPEGVTLDDPPLFSCYATDGTTYMYRAETCSLIMRDGALRFLIHHGQSEAGVRVVLIE